MLRRSLIKTQRGFALRACRCCPGKMTSAAANLVAELSSAAIDFFQAAFGSITGLRIAILVRVANLNPAEFKQHINNLTAVIRAGLNNLMWSPHHSLYFEPSLFLRRSTMAAAVGPIHPHTPIFRPTVSG